MITFFAYLLAGFIGMEVISYLIHRFLFHGLLWSLHQTHHKPDESLFEWNDLFSLVFAIWSIYLMIAGSASIFTGWKFPVGTGIALYGVLYFIIHDLYTHKRFLPIRSNSWFMQLIKRAHQNHHQSVDKKGCEPYGLFLFPYREYEDRVR